jgi:adenosine deaminase
MSGTIPVFVNERYLAVAPGATVRQAVGLLDPALASGLGGGVAATDGRGLPLDPDAPVTAGSIIRAVRSARRADAGKGGVTRELLARFPKAELHVHLDGSLRPATMLELARAGNLTLPASTAAELARAMLVEDAASLEQFLHRFDITVALLQDPESIERVAYEIVEDAARDNVRYLEIRYCPRLSTRNGLTLDEVIRAEARGLERGERDFGVRTGIINCSLRHYDPAISLEIARHSVRMQDHKVVAFDLAGAEAGRPPGPHGPAFDVALAGGLGITVHAGEAAGPESIREAIDRCHAMRIGHGTRLHEDPELVARVKERGIPLEVNLTSNVQTRAVPSAAEHPVRRYFDQGLAVTLCTDSWLMCGVTLTDEYWLAHQALDFSRAELERLVMTGFEAAFLPAEEKNRLVTRVGQELAAIV